MSIIKAGGRDFWAEAYQLAKQIEAKETNKIHQTNKNIKQNRIQQRAEEKALEKQAIRSDMLINDLSLQSINDSLPPIKSTYETAEKPSFKTNTLNTPTADNRQFYPIPPSYLANSTLNKDVKIGAKENNDLSLYPKYFPTSATQHSKAPFTTLDAQIRSAALNNLTADGGLGITTTLPYSSLLSDIPSTIPVLNSKKGKNLLKGLGAAVALSASLLGGLGTDVLGLSTKSIVAKPTASIVPPAAITNQIKRLDDKTLTKLLKDKGTSAYSIGVALDNFRTIESVLKGDPTKPTGAAVNLFGEQSSLYTSANNIGKIKGYNVIGGHGDYATGGNFMWDGYTKSEAKKYKVPIGTKLTPEQAFEIMRKSPGYNPDLPTIILNCEAAKGTFAKRFAKASKQDVVAATEEMIYNPSLGNTYGPFATTFSKGKPQINWTNPGKILRYNKDGVVIQKRDLTKYGADVARKSSNISDVTYNNIVRNSTLSYTNISGKPVGSYTNFFGENTLIQHAMAEVSGRQGFNTLVGHASPDGMFKGALSHEIVDEKIPNAKVGSFLSAAETAKEVRQSPGYNKDLPLFVYGCRFARSKEFSKLAKELNTPVYAFTERGFGTLGTFEKDPKTGRAILDKPGRILKAMPDGSITPMTELDLK